MKNEVFRIDTIKGTLRKLEIVRTKNLPTPKVWQQEKTEKERGRRRCTQRPDTQKERNPDACLVSF